MKKQIYKIHIIGWGKYNSNSKPGHPNIMISKRFFDDAKISTLSSGGKLLYLGLLLRRGDVKTTLGGPSGEVDTTFIECSYEVLVTLAGGSGQVVSRLLDRLVELQLLTYEKKSLIEVNRIEVNLKEKKRNSVKGTKSEKQKSNQVEFVDANASPPVESNIGKKLVGVYCDFWKQRYKSNPPIRPQDAKVLKQVGESNGFDRTKSLLEAYLRMNEKWFLQKRHDLATFMNNLTSVAHFIETGRVITGQDLRNVDRAIANKNTLDALEKGEI